MTIKYKIKGIQEMHCFGDSFDVTSVPGLDSQHIIVNKYQSDCLNMAGDHSIVQELSYVD